MPSRLTASLRRYARGAILIAMAIGVLLGWEAILILGPPNAARRFVDNSELAIYDGHVRALPAHKPDPRIVIVEMDDESLNHLPKLDRPYYPLPRGYHGRLVDELFKAGAKVIGFDIMFTLPREGPDEDSPFARALRRHGNVISALTPTVALEGGAEHAHFDPPAPALRPYLFAASILLPSGRVRWFDPYRTDDDIPGVRYPHFGLALAAAYHDETRATPDLRDTFHWGSHVDAPVTTLSEHEQTLIRYIGPTGTYPSIPYYKVYNGDWRRESPNLFRGKIVLVGRASALEDQHDTPRGQMEGVEILATIAGNALGDDWLSRAGPQAPMAVAALLMAVYVLVLWRWTLAPAALAGGFLALLWFFTPGWILKSRGIWIETMPPLLSLGCLLALSTVYETARMRGQFRKFMPTWVADRVLTGGAGTVGAPGETTERPVTVVFCDIRRFTELFDTRPRESTELLRRFFDAGDRLARKHGTELDKYIGDELMLYFFERRGLAPHPIRAVRWAADMLKAAEEIDRSGLAGEIGFRLGIGVATGVAHEGFVGVRKRIQSTVIGDVVNLASRLQDATKSLGRPVLMNEATYLTVRGAIPAEPLGAISVKGKQEPVAVYAIRDARHSGETAAVDVPSENTDSVLNSRTEIRRVEIDETRRE